MLPIVHATSEELLKGVVEADRDQLIRALARIRANVEGMSARPVPQVKLRRRARRSP